MDRDYSPREVVTIVKRRRWAVVASVFAGLALAAAASLALPKSYRCSTKLQVSANGNIAGSEYAKRVDAVRDQICSMVNMERVVDDLGLASSGEGDAADRRTAVARNLINATRVEKDEPLEGTYFIRVEFTGRDPDTAYRVVQSLVAGFRSELYNRPRLEQQQQVDGARKAVEAAVGKAEEAQARCAEHQQEHGELLRPLEQDLADCRKQIEGLETKDLVLWGDKLKQAKEGLEKEQPFITHETPKVDSVRMAAVESELNNARRRLNELTITKKYTDEHPEVMAAAKYVKDLEGQKADLEKNAPVSKDHQPNPMYAKLKELEMEAQSALLVAEKSLQQLRLNEKSLQENIKLAPPVRARQSGLDGDLKSAQQFVEDCRIALSKAEARLEQLDSERQLSFETVDAPLPPRGPAGPSPLLFAFAGVVIGGGAGLGVAWILEIQDHSFREVDAVAGFLGVPSLGAIHMIETPSEAAEARTKSSRKLAAVAALGFVAVALAGAAVWSASRASEPRAAEGGVR